MHTTGISCAIRLYCKTASARRLPIINIHASFIKEIQSEITAISYEANSDWLMVQCRITEADNVCFPLEMLKKIFQ